MRLGNLIFFEFPDEGKYGTKHTRLYVFLPAATTVDKPVQSNLFKSTATIWLVRLVSDFQC